MPPENDVFQMATGYIKMEFVNVLPNTYVRIIAIFSLGSTRCHSGRQKALCPLLAVKAKTE